ncbi:MurR/RpiR family transcriptional regulator [Aminivibrio sp.]|uniref:MurR/RpiR family transcriptional regulator n=1 Tax=Aminivibrio sp. TaxID=1872489 RepID=UPI00345EBD5E
MDIIEHLQEVLPKLSEKQQIVIRILLNDSHRVPFMTIRELSDLAKVSTTTVLRVVESLGFSHFKDMCRAFHENSITAPPLQKLREGKVAESYTDPFFLHQVISFEQENLSAILTPFLHSNFIRAIKVLNSAGRIRVIGARSAFSAAYYLGFLLQQFMDNVIITSSNSDNLYEQICCLGESDAAIVFAFPRYSKSTVRISRFLYEHGVPVIAVTDCPLSPLTKYSACSLYCRNTSPFYSYTAAMSVCNGIILGLKETLGSSFNERLKNIGDILQEEEIYY